MKKLYSLLLLLVSILSFSQGSINFDDATKWTQGTAAFTSYSNHTYVDGNFSLACLDVIRNTTALQDVFAGAFGTYSLRLQNDATTEVVFTIATGGVGNFTFKARRWDSAPDTNFAVEFSTDGGTTWTASSTINVSVTNDSDWKTINGVINSANANVKVRVKSNGTTERLMIDDFSWTSPSTDPSLLITSPSNGTNYGPTVTSASINLLVSNFTVANGTGQGHIHYTLNTVAQPMKYDTTPIELTSLTPGTYTVFVELVDNSHNPIVPAVNATVTFTIAAYTVVTDLAALRADVIANGAGRYYQVSSNPVVTFKRTTRNQKYIQDASAAIVIDDAAAVITTTMVAGDAISSLKGQSLLFNGLLELTPTENATVASSGNTVTPQVVTISDVIANLETYESELVQINSVTFDATATNFAVNTNTPITAPTASVFRTVFTATEVDYIATAIPTTATNVIVFPGENTVAVPTPSVYFVARSLADLTLVNQSFSIAGLTITPNPVNNGVFYINTDANAERTVTVFDVLGKQVLNTTTSESAINVSNLTAGVYLVQVVEEGKTATKKLVIR